MDKSPNKEMLKFLGEAIGVSGVIFTILGLVILKFMESLGLIEINFWNF